MALSVLDGCGAFGCATGIGIVHVGGTGYRALVPTDDFDGYVSGTPAWSPDGTAIAYNYSACFPRPCETNDVFVVDLASGRTRFLLRDAYCLGWWP